MVIKLFSVRFNSIEHWVDVGDLKSSFQTLLHISSVHIDMENVMEMEDKNYCRNKSYNVVVSLHKMELYYYTRLV